MCECEAASQMKVNKRHTMYICIAALYTLFIWHGDNFNFLPFLLCYEVSVLLRSHGEPKCKVLQMTFLHFILVNGIHIVKYYVASSVVRVHLLAYYPQNYLLINIKCTFNSACIALVFIFYHTLNNVNKATQNLNL